MADSTRTQSRRGIAVAGLRGGSGKTLVTLGLIGALRRSGIAAAPFKKGPDYIDPAWLTRAAGRHCHNLDTYLLERDAIIDTYLSRNSDCAVAVVEGNRGIFDGMDIEGTHSVAGLAGLLGIPVILVADCAKASRTVAAMVRGCQAFDPDLALRGVILNRVAGERHRSITAGAIERYCGIPVLGAIPRIPGLDLAERSLGLVPVQEHTEPDRIIETITRAVGAAVDLDGIMAIMERHGYPSLASLFGGPADSAAPSPETGKAAPTIGVIRDSAFTFYYPENIEALAGSGAAIVEIDSMRDAALPPIDGLYIGGGFPETHAREIAANVSLRKAIRDAVEEGLPVYAECGGLVYLSETLDAGGTEYPMTGVFPLRFTVSRKPQGHGYTCFTVDRGNPYYPQGTVVRGHEFRYSRLNGAGAVETVFSMERGTGLREGRDGVLYKNALGTFCHTHALGSGVTWPRALVALARERIS
ncbi:MAG: cobyrinate a,c-diamide synthase [Spirochaetes bacterium]|nr:cobyrinate a,c-diamide synthase [Spirochaetota bacterium]